jgi:hypothetical protein
MHALCSATLSAILLLTLATFPVRAQGDSATVDHIEFVQSVQDDQNSVPLIAGRPTFVRIFITYNGKNESVVGQLSIRGEAQPIASFRPNGDEFVPPVTPLSDRRLDTNGALLFKLPEKFTVPGTIEARLQSLSLTDGGPISCGNCGSYRKTIAFQPGFPLKVTIVGVNYNRAGREIRPTYTDYGSIISWLTRSYPASQVIVRIKEVTWEDAPGWFDDGLVACNALNALLLQRRRVDIASGQDRQFHYYGVVYQDLQHNNNTLRGCSSIPVLTGNPPRPSPDAVASGPAGRRWFASDTYASFAGWYAAHELGHSFGRKHLNSGCGDKENPPPAWPQGVDRQHIGSESHPYVGFDYGDPGTLERMRVLPWNRTADIMTYCVQKWLSAYNYLAICERLANEHGSRCIEPVASASAAVAARVMPAGPAFAQAPDTPSDPRTQGSAIPTLSITGTINLDANTASISYVNKIEGVRSPPLAASDDDTPMIQAYDRDGKLLSATNGEIYLSSDRPEGAPQLGVLTGEIPYSPQIARIEVQRRGKVIAERISEGAKAQISKPQVQMPTLENYFSKFKELGNSGQIMGAEKEAPWAEKSGSTAGWNLVYQWSPENATGAERYTVQITTDNGKSWDTVALETRRTSIEINPTWIVGAKMLQVRVKASDGIHEFTQTSAPLDLTARLTPYEGYPK